VLYGKEAIKQFPTYITTDYVGTWSRRNGAYGTATSAAPSIASGRCCLR